MSDSFHVSHIDRSARRSSRRSGRQFETLGFVAIGVILLAFLAVLGYFAYQFFVPAVARAPLAQAPAALTGPAPGGVTVISREQAGEPAPTPPRPPADITQKLDGYAIELGGALSFAELSARFAAISRQNAEAELDKLEPRATLKDTATGLEARLLVGPFADMQAAKDTCASLALPSTIACRAVPFEGELISRE